MTTGGRGDEVLFVLVRVELQVEAGQDLGVFLLRRDDLDVVAELGAEQLQRLLRSRLRRGNHLAELGEHDLHERGRVGADAVGEVGEARATRQADRVALTARNLHAADRRRLHVVELLTPLLLRLAATGGTTAGAASERALGRSTAAATTGSTRTATAEATATRTTGRACTRATGTTRTATRTTGAEAAAAATAGTTGAEATAATTGTACAPRTAGTTGTTRSAARAARTTGHARTLRQAGTRRHHAGRGRPRRHHAGRAGTRRARTRRHRAWCRLAGGEGVVAGPRRTGTRRGRPGSDRSSGRRSGRRHLVVVVLADRGRLDLREDLLDRRVQHGRRRGDGRLRLGRCGRRSGLLRGGLLRLGSSAAIGSGAVGACLDLREGSEHLGYDGCFDRRRRCLDVLTVVVEPLNELF